MQLQPPACLCELQAGVQPCSAICPRMYLWGPIPSSFLSPIPQCVLGACMYLVQMLIAHSA